MFIQDNKNNLFDKKFVIEVNHKLSNLDYIVLRNLYTPIIGIKATMLYQILIDYGKISDNLKTHFPLDVLSKTLEIDWTKLELVRQKLEAVGLLRTFQKKDYKFYIFVINKPLSIKAFRNNFLLFDKLIKKIGIDNFEKFAILQNKPIYKKDNFQEISIKFQDIFQLNNIDKLEKSTLKKITFKMPNFTNLSIENAIKSLTPIQFVNFLTHKEARSSLLQILNKMQIWNFSNKTINEIINYSFLINGKIVGNYIFKIAQDLFSKKLITYDIVCQELKAALNFHNKREVNNRIDKVDHFIVHNNDLKNIDSKLDWDEITNSIGEL